MTQTNCRAAQKVRKRVNVSLDMIVQRLSLITLHESVSGAGRSSISKTSVRCGLDTFRRVLTANYQLHKEQYSNLQRQYVDDKMS